MKIVVAPDKFKGSLTGMQFCDLVEEGINEINPNAKILKLPLADGGDGTIEVINYYLKGRTINIEVNNPFFKPIKASYLFADVPKSAFIEMAEASGVKLLDKSEFDVKNATTFGTGELIVDAVSKGAMTIILGIGGSATNDCGIGMATALGYKFLDVNNKAVLPIGKNLIDITSIDDSEVNPKLKDVTFKIACDVTNPLYGNNGAAFVYAKQKGATESEIEMLDSGLQSFSKVLDSHFKVDSQRVKGAGAAGGMGIASHCFLNGHLESGIDIMKDLANFNEKIENADWIITGEGKLDRQTLSGKTINGVVESAKNHKLKIAAFCGSNELSEIELNEFGIDYVDSVLDKADNLDDAIKNAGKYLKILAREFVVKI